MRRVLIVLTFALLLSACDLAVDPGDDGKEKGMSVDSVAVGFQAYVNRATKAGPTGDLTTEALKTAGFGVFGYYGGSSLYDETLKPEFMYNQKVAYDGTTYQWTYKPIKFWPNEYARLTFFAYAPHVAVTASTGAVSDNSTTGIIGTINKDAQGDPLVKYGASLTPGQGVDLCWAEPYIDKAKQSANEKLNFLFNHALAQLNVQIDTDVDVESHNTSSLDAGTHIYVRSVSFTGFTTRGSLNLNSPANNPVWRDLSGTGVLKRDPVTIYDGRSDGYEGMTTGVNPNEVPATLNPVLVQSEPYSGSPTAGVTNTAVNLFNGPTAESSLMVIPVPGAPLTVTIVYDVETADGKMQDYLSDGVTPGLSMENRITRTIQLDDGSNMFLSAGKRYEVKLHLGLTSVLFDATVCEWSDGGTVPVNPVDQGSLSSVSFSESSLTSWIGELATSPSLSILADDGTSLAGATGLEIKWRSSDTRVADVNASTGAITLNSFGSTEISAQVTLNNITKTASYTLYVNKVTGISVTPSSVAINPTAEKTLIASITINGDNNQYGRITDWPDVAWSSNATDHVTVTPVSATNTTSSATIRGVATGDATITASVTSPYSVSSLSANCLVSCVSPWQTAFRGYDVSSGILVRNDNGTYSMTGGNPFELADYHGQSSSLNKYYFRWSDLKAAFGADGDNIDSDSADIPGHDEGWILPTGSNDGMWREILEGSPKAKTIVNNTELSDHLYALITVDRGNGVYHKGLLLIRDGSNIPGSLLRYTGYDSSCSNNVLTEAQFNMLVGEEYRCVFLSSTGCYTLGRWYDNPTSTVDGYYWSSSASNICMNFKNNNVSSRSQVTSDDFYCPVRLVKKMNTVEP